MMEIVRVYREHENFTSQDGFAVVDDISLSVSKWSTDDQYSSDCVPVSVEVPTPKLLFYTSLGDYDGGYQVCEAFIEGYEKGLPVEPPKFTSIQSCA
jgi:hypothetical protein